MTRVEFISKMNKLRDLWDACDIDDDEYVLFIKMLVKYFEED